jgi:hypothetical protein
MDASIRPPQYRRQAAGKILSRLAAVLVFAGGGAFAAPSRMDETSAISTAPAPFSSEDQTAISSVAPGQEGLDLSARFSGDGTSLAKDVSWTVHDSAGSVVFNDVAATASVKLQPGTYVINATYGTAHIEEAVNLPEGINLGVNLVLNAGGLRLLPRIEGSLPVEVGTIAKIFALNGPAAGKLVATSRLPGEVLKLGAGDYRIESRFERGNAVAVTEVRVKPGIMSAVNIDHHAALVHFTYAHESAATVSWQISRDTGEILPEFSGLDADLVLKPGHYLAQARSGASLDKVEFTIEQGQNREVILGK